MSDVAKQLRQRADWDTPHCNELLAAAREIEEYEAALKLQVTYAENVVAAAHNVIEECERRSADVEQGRARAITVPWLDLNVLRQTIAMKPGADRAQVLFDQECADTVALEAQPECVHETCTKPNETREGRWDYDDQDRTFYHTDFSTDAMLKLDGDWASVDQRITFAARVLKALAGEFCHQSCTQPPTDADYAMQHAGYLATAATALMDACNVYEEAREKHEDAEPGAEAAAAYDVMFAAQEARGEAWSGLRTAVYEFEKRRDRALRHQVNREVEVLRYERDVARAHRDRLADILTAIHARLAAPEGFEHQGKFYTFDPQDKTRYWAVHQALCARIRAIPDELTAAAVDSQSVACTKREGGNG